MDTSRVLPAVVERSISRYLAGIDRSLPGAVVGFYVVGSVALGAYRERRSDIDFVAVIDGAVDQQDVRRLRVEHARCMLRTAVDACARRRSPTAGACNGVFIRHADVGKPVAAITPAAAHIGGRFTTGPVGSDVSPVAWKVLAERGIAVRGVHPSALGLDWQPESLFAWNLENLERYWGPWATSTSWSSRLRFRLRPRWSTAWGVLGAPRLHRTMATGEVVSKEAAGDYARDVFPRRFEPLIADALAYWREERPPRPAMDPDGRRLATSAFVLHVIESARSLDRSGSSRPA